MRRKPKNHPDVHRQKNIYESGNFSRLVEYLQTTRYNVIDPALVAREMTSLYRCRIEEREIEALLPVTEIMGLVCSADENGRRSVRRVKTGKSNSGLIALSVSVVVFLAMAAYGMSPYVSNYCAEIGSYFRGTDSTILIMAIILVIVALAGIVILILGLSDGSIKFNPEIAKGYIAGKMLSNQEQIKDDLHDINRT